MSKHIKIRDKRNERICYEAKEDIKDFDEYIILKAKQFSRLGIKNMYLAKAKKDCIYFNKGDVKKVKENAYVIFRKSQFEINKDLFTLCEVLNTDKVYMKILNIEEFNNTYPNHKFNKEEN